jgi:hypothetical protein
MIERTQPSLLYRLTEPLEPGMAHPSAQRTIHVTFSLDGAHYVMLPALVREYNVPARRVRVTEVRVQPLCEEA